jgi:hypothetical protein
MDTPHKAVATAVFYFAMSAVFKWICAVLRKYHPDRRRKVDSTAEPLEAFDLAK